MNKFFKLTLLSILFFSGHICAVKDDISPEVRQTVEKMMDDKAQAGADYSQLLYKTCMGDDKKVDVKCMQDHYAAFVKAYGQALADHFYIPAFKPAGK